MTFRNALPLGLCAVAGTLVWVLTVVGRTGEELVPVTFWLSMLVVGVVGGLVTEGVPSPTVSITTFSGPMVLALWTAPRGDNDGLWVVIEPLLLFAAALVTWSIDLIRRFLPTVSLPPVITAAAVVVGAVAIPPLLADRRADPYPDLERRVAEIDLPSSMALVGIERGGDPLCSGTCTPYVAATFTTTGSPAEACDLLEREVGSTWCTVEGTRVTVEVRR